MHGDDEIETNGRFDTLRNRMDAEIKRQWPKSTAAKPEMTPSSAGLPAASPATATPTNAEGFKQWLDGASRHPIIVGLVLLGVPALITGLWPPALPADPIDLSTTRSLIETAHAHATLVNLQIEREDPDVAFIGVPTRWSPKNLWLHEVSDRAIWDDTDSKWPFADITRVEFSSTYEDDLLLVAGPPPDR